MDRSISPNRSPNRNNKSPKRTVDAGTGNDYAVQTLGQFKSGRKSSLKRFKDTGCGEGTVESSNNKNRREKFEEEILAKTQSMARTASITLIPTSTVLKAKRSNNIDESWLVR